MNSMKRTRHAFRNTSGEDIPPYALVRIADGSDTLKQQILDGDIPDDNDNSIYLANGPKTIAADKIGHGYWTTEPCVVAYDPAWVTPAAGQEWGPTADNWYLCEDGEGFIVLSVDSVKGLCRIGKKDRITKSVIQGAAGACGCGTQYPHGTVTLTWSTVDIEHATTYQTDWTDIPEVTDIGGGVWESADVTLDSCYGGIRQSKVRLTPIEPLSMTASDFDGGVITFTAKLEVVSVANSCTGVDADLGDITAKYYCENWNPLATSTFRLVTYHNTGNYQFPCTICIAPRYTLVTCNGIDIPESFRLMVDSYDDSGLPSHWVLDKTVVYDHSSGGCCFYTNDVLDSPRVRAFIEVSTDALRIGWWIPDAGGSPITGAWSLFDYSPATWSWSGDFTLSTRGSSACVTLPSTAIGTLRSAP